jgi:hypothetical protein
MSAPVGTKVRHQSGTVYTKVTENGWSREGDVEGYHTAAEGFPFRQAIEVLETFAAGEPNDLLTLVTDDESEASDV